MEKWAANGAYVTIADVNDTAGENAVGKITSGGGKAQYVHCDVLNWESSNEAFKSAVNFGPSKTLDISALYAGVIGTANNMIDILKENGAPSLSSVPPIPTHKAIDINLTGEWYSTYLSFHYMQLKPQTNGVATGPNGGFKKSIVMISSLAGYVDYPNNSAYAAGKFGVRGLWRSIRSRAPELGVRTNLIAPWFVDTPMVRTPRSTFSILCLFSCLDQDFSWVAAMLEDGAGSDSKTSESRPSWHFLVSQRNFSRK